MVDGQLYFLLFDDQTGNWRQIREKWSSMSCSEKVNASKWSYNVELSESHDNTSLLIYQHIRPRFWYFTFVGCELPEYRQGGLMLRYKVHTRNLHSGWQEEFSMDRFGLFAVYAVFGALFALLTLATFCASRRRISPLAPPGGPTFRDHPYVQLLLLASLASFASCGLFLVHYTIFMQNGLGSLGIRFIAVLAAIVANCSIFLLAVLCSVGWAISNAELPFRRVFLGLTTLVGGVNALCELRAETAVDQSTKMYSYQSVPGMMSLVLKILIFCWVLRQLRQTFKGEKLDINRCFYQFFGFAIAIWSIGVPVTVLLAVAVSPWYRYKVVISTEIAVRMTSLLLLSFIFCGRSSPLTEDNVILMRDDDWSPQHTESASFTG